MPQKRDNVIHLRATATEKELCERNAEYRDMSVASYILSLIRADADKIRREEMRKQREEQASQ